MQMASASRDNQRTLLAVWDPNRDRVVQVGTGLMEQAQLLEGWRDEWRPQAEREVQFALLVPEIAAAEDIEVTEEDVDARLRQIAEERDETVNRVKRAYKESGLLEALRAGLLEERVVEFLVAEATLSNP